MSTGRSVIVKGYRQRLGKRGEEIATRHLEDKGYEIIERNWRCSRGEIDIVARTGEALIFVEVKTRRGRQAGTPEEGLTVAKGEKLLQLAQIYLSEKELDVDWQIDLVAIDFAGWGKVLRCEHIPNAVLGW